MLGSWRPPTACIGPTALKACWSVGFPPGVSLMFGAFLDFGYHCYRDWIGSQRNHSGTQALKFATIALLLRNHMRRYPRIRQHPLWYDTRLIKAGKPFAVEERLVYHCFIPLRLKCCICITSWNSSGSAVRQLSIGNFQVLVEVDITVAVHVLFWVHLIHFADLPGRMEKAQYTSSYGDP